MDFLTSLWQRVIIFSHTECIADLDQVWPLIFTFYILHGKACHMRYMMLKISLSFNMSHLCLPNSLAQPSQFISVLNQVIEKFTIRVMSKIMKHPQIDMSMLFLWFWCVLHCGFSIFDTTKKLYDKHFHYKSDISKLWKPKVAAYFNFSFFNFEFSFSVFIRYSSLSASESLLWSKDKELRTKANTQSWDLKVENSNCVAVLGFQIIVIHRYHVILSERKKLLQKWQTVG